MIVRYGLITKLCVLLRLLVAIELLCVLFGWPSPETSVLGPDVGCGVTLSSQGFIATLGCRGRVTLGCVDVGHRMWRFVDPLEQPFSPFSLFTHLHSPVSIAAKPSRTAGRLPPSPAIPPSPTDLRSSTSSLPPSPSRLLPDASSILAASSLLAASDRRPASSPPPTAVQPPRRLRPPSSLLAASDRRPASSSPPTAVQPSRPLADRYPILHRHIYESDTMAISQIRMSRRCFTKLCHMLETFGGLKPSRNMNIDEQVAIFLHILAHNVKNRVIICRFRRSGETIICNATIRLHNRLLKKPEAVPDNSTDQKWKWFKNCLGALDGTYIKCLVPVEENPRYRTRKNDIATNVLGVCSQDMQFIYVLTGWEGSAADGRVLRDALLRPYGLKVPRPGYYLVDAGYTNGEGFLAPYRGQRYHLNEWRNGHQPTTAKEFFNMKHSSARNVIERCFGILKGRWGILKDNSYYPIEKKR
ncbi:hypothetical protein OSB04_031298 [Centaurea solstitialis]|uniref:Transposase n=1 Tax=Centaurea solstitialis TaxID=347529 RepID=A0AA38W4L6_9ASTR|nr:hypothetical protein OSB04_031298 [Centaurea solstitialis]